MEFHFYANTLGRMLQFIQLHCEIYGDPCVEGLQALTCSFINVGLPVNVIHLKVFVTKGTFLWSQEDWSLKEFFFGGGGGVGLPNFL